MLQNVTKWLQTFQCKFREFISIPKLAVWSFVYLCVLDWCLVLKETFTLHTKDVWDWWRIASYFCPASENQLLSCAMGSSISESKDCFANEVHPPSPPEIISIEGTGHDVDDERTFYFLSNAGSSLHIPESATFPQLRFNPGKRIKNMIMWLVTHTISSSNNNVDFISQTWSKNLSLGSNVFALDIPLIICIRIVFLSMTGFHCCLVEHEAPEHRQSTYFGSGNSTATDLTDIEQFQINPIDIPPVGLQATAPFPIILKASLQSLHPWHLFACTKTLECTG